MPVRNINLNPGDGQIRRTANPRGPLCQCQRSAASRSPSLEEDEKEDQARLEALRTAIHAGEESGIAEGDVFQEVRDYVRKLAEEKTIRDSKKYQQARRRALARLRRGFDLKYTPPRSRDELHDRYATL